MDTDPLVRKRFPLFESFIYKSRSNKSRSDHETSSKRVILRPGLRNPSPGTNSTSRSESLESSNRKNYLHFSRTSIENDSNTVTRHKNRSNSLTNSPHFDIKSRLTFKNRVISPRESAYCLFDRKNIKFLTQIPRPTLIHCSNTALPDHIDSCLTNSEFRNINSNLPNNFQLTLLHLNSCKRVQIQNCSNLAGCDLNVLYNICCKTFPEHTFNKDSNFRVFICNQNLSEFQLVTDPSSIPNDASLYIPEQGPLNQDLESKKAPISNKLSTEASSTSGVESSDSSALSSGNEASGSNLTAYFDGKSTESGHSTPKNKTVNKPNKNEATLKTIEMTSNTPPSQTNQPSAGLMNGTIGHQAVVVLPGLAGTQQLATGTVRGQITGGTISRVAAVPSGTTQILTTGTAPTSQQQQQILAAIKSATGGQIPQGTIILKSNPGGTFQALTTSNTQGSVGPSLNQNGTIQLARIASRSTILAPNLDAGKPATLMVQSQTGQPVYYAVPVRQAIGATGPGPPATNTTRQLVQTAPGPAVLVQQASAQIIPSSSGQTSNKPLGPHFVISQNAKTISTNSQKTSSPVTTTSSGSTSEHLICTCPPELHQSGAHGDHDGNNSKYAPHQHSAHCNASIYAANQSQQTNAFANKVAVPLNDTQAHVSYLMALFQALQESGVRPESFTAAFNRLSFPTAPSSSSISHLDKNSKLSLLRSSYEETSQVKLELQEMRNQQTDEIERFGREMRNCQRKINHMLQRYGSYMKNCSVSPLLEPQVQQVRIDRIRLDNAMADFQSTRSSLVGQLADLEGVLEETGMDIVQGRCLINTGLVDAFEARLQSTTSSILHTIERYPLLRHQFALQIEAEALTNSYEKASQEDQLKVLEELKIKCIKIMKTVITFRKLASIHDQGRSEEQIERTKRKLSDLLSDVTNPSSYDPKSKERAQLVENIAKLNIDHAERVRKVEFQEALRERRKRVFADIPELQQPDVMKTNALFANLGGASALATASVDENAFSRRSESFAAAKVVNRIVAASNGSVNQDSYSIPMIDESTDSSENTAIGSNLSSRSSPTPMPLMIIPQNNHGKASILKGSSSSNALSTNTSFKSSRQTNRVMFSTKVFVEDGAEVLRLNCLTNGFTSDHISTTADFHEGGEVSDEVKIYSPTRSRLPATRTRSSFLPKSSSIPAATARPRNTATLSKPFIISSRSRTVDSLSATVSPCRGSIHNPQQSFSPDRIEPRIRHNSGDAEIASVYNKVGFFPISASTFDSNKNYSLKNKYISPLTKISRANFSSISNSRTPPVSSTPPPSLNHFNENNNSTFPLKRPSSSIAETNARLRESWLLRPIVTSCRSPLNLDVNCRRQRSLSEVISGSFESSSPGLSSESTSTSPTVSNSASPRGVQNSPFNKLT